MPSSSSERTFARRALIEDIREDRKSWLRHGVAALAVSVLGLGVAGSVALTGAAQHTTLTATVATTDLAKKTSRAAERGRLDPAKIKSIADQRDEELSKIGAEVSEASMDRSAKARAKALQKLSDSTRRQAILLKRGQASRSDTARYPTPARALVAGAACLLEVATALLPASARSAHGRVITPAWTSPLPSVPHCTLRLMGSSPMPGLDLPAAGPATMSLSSTRMAPTR